MNLIYKNGKLHLITEMPEELEICTLGKQDQCEDMCMYIQELSRFVCPCRAKEIAYEKALLSAPSIEVENDTETLNVIWYKQTGGYKNIHDFKLEIEGKIIQHDCSYAVVGKKVKVHVGLPAMRGYAPKTEVKKVAIISEVTPKEESLEKLYTLQELIEHVAAYSICHSDFTVEETKTEYPHQFKGKVTMVKQWLKGIAKQSKSNIEKWR